MIKLDDQLLSDLGLSELPAPHAQLVLRAIYSELETRVGTMLANRMSNKQLIDFEAFIGVDDREEALAWLESNFPDYKSVVQGEFDKLRAELSRSRDAIIALSSLYASDALAHGSW